MRFEVGAGLVTVQARLPSDQKDYMPDEYYPMADEGAGSETTPDETAQPGSESTDEQADGETKSEGALVPKSLFDGKALAVGDKVEMEISHVYEDEVLVCPAYSKKTETDRSPSADEEIDAMDTKGD